MMISPTNEPLMPDTPGSEDDSMFEDSAINFELTSASASASASASSLATPAASTTLRIPSLRSTASDSATITTNTSTMSSPLGSVTAARRPAPSASMSTVRAGGISQDMQARMKAFHLSRQGTPPGQRIARTTSRPALGAVTGTFVGVVNGADGSLLSPTRPHVMNVNSAPAIPHARAAPALGLAAKRGLNRGMKLSDATGPVRPASQDQSDAQISGGIAVERKPDSLFTKYSEFVDTATGSLKFKGKAIIHGDGIDFSSGHSFKISLDEVDTLEELGKGNYGTVYKVRHSRPRIRRPGLGLVGNKAPSSMNTAIDGDSPIQASSPGKSHPATSGLIMAMKEIRLELDEAKFAAIIMELDVLHRCVSPFIVDFYGAFFQEGAVYICMEFMNGGSIDKLYGDGIPENVLRKIALSTVMGLKALKDDHNIIHRDVKPTNILVNSKGQVKICDFGVSGNLVASIAKTNIGCQSYMAPERISSGGMSQAGANPGGGTYSVQSDVWSLGLSIIEMAMGQYPYPPETYNNIFSQLSAIVEGDPPDLPDTGYSSAARDFVKSCLNKVPKLRPTYAMLIRHPWVVPLLKPPVIPDEAEDESHSGDSPIDAALTADEEVAAWVIEAMERRQMGRMGQKEKPALHAAPLDSVHSPP